MHKQPRQLKSTEIASLRNWILNKRQDGKCLICGNEPKRPCLDHDHIKRIKGTGLIRGVLCSSCNVFIAKSENNCIRYGIKIKELPDILRSVANYLEKKQYPYIHPSEKPKELKLKKNSFKKIKKLYHKDFPNRKQLEYPKSKKLTKLLKDIYETYNISPEFLKN